MTQRTAPILTLHHPSNAQEYYESGVWQKETIYAIALRNVAAAPDAYALRDARRRLTWSEVVKRADAIAARLAALGLRQGDRIGIWLPNCIEVPLLLLACSRNGYICAPSFHKSHTVSEVVELMCRIDAQALVARPGWGADSAQNDIFSQLLTCKTIKALLAPDDVTGLEGVENLPTTIIGGDLLPDPCHDPDKVTYLAFTSGTTGMPKGVMHSDNTLLANARAVMSDWHLTSSEHIFVVSPLSHHNGTVAFQCALVAGAEFVVNDTPKGKSYLDSIIECEADFVVGVPTHVIDLLAEMQQRGIERLGRVRAFYVAGAAIPPSICQRLLELGVKPMCAYGMTENGSTNYTLPADDIETQLKTCGRVCKGYEARIWSSADVNVEAAAGEIGEIGGRGGLLMLGYFDNQKETEKSFNSSGWFMSGDLGRFDENGNLEVLGRLKDLIIRGGHNIYPSQIEALALRHPDIEKAAAFPVPDERLGEKVCLAIIASKEVAPYAMLEWLGTAGLSRFDMPEYFIACESFPLTPSGKVLKREMAAQVQNGTLVPQSVRWTPS